jgi:DNA-binding CsgD family transcriptional regulator
MLIVAVYCLPSGFMTGRPVLLESSMSSLGTVMFGGIALLLLAVAFGGIVFARPAGEDFMYRLIVPLLAAGLLLVPFVTNVAQGVAGIAIMGGYIILEMYVWSALQDIARKGPDGPALVYGVGKTGMNLGLFVGCLLGMYAYGQSTVLVLGVSVAIVYAFILLGSLGPRASGPRLAPLLATESELDVRSDGQTAPSADVRAIIEAARASRCDELAGLYGLSQRERDVLELLACGRSLDAIAASLGIAQSTVRSHRDHIYRKLGIHGRQELIDLLEGE